MARTLSPKAEAFPRSRPSGTFHSGCADQRAISGPIDGSIDLGTCALAAYRAEQMLSEAGTPFSTVAHTTGGQAHPALAMSGPMRW